MLKIFLISKFLDVEDTWSKILNKLETLFKGVGMNAPPKVDLLPNAERKISSLIQRGVFL